MPFLSLDLLEAALYLVVLVEALFYVWCRVEQHRAQAVREPPHLSSEERSFIWAKMCLHAESYGFWKQAQGWFVEKDDLGATRSPPEEMGRVEVLELIAWALFYKRLEDLDADEAAWADAAAERAFTEKDLARRVRAGRTGLVPMRNTLDPVRVWHRPLLVYLSVFLLRFEFGVLLRMRGFHRARHKGLWYWHRLSGRGPRGTSRAAPIVGGEAEPLAFFHGIGLGLVQYAPLLLRLGQRDQIFFEMPFISMNPFAPVPSAAEYSRWVAEALEGHGISRCVAVGHSYGSVPIAWLIRRYPGLVAQCVLVAPVAVLLNLPDVCLNFLYKRPQTAHSWLIRAFASRELSIARTLMRHFFWTENVIFPEMLPPGSSVILEGDDCILPNSHIYQSSRQVSQIHTDVIEGADHASFLFSSPAIDLVLKHLGSGSPDRCTPLKPLCSD